MMHSAIQEYFYILPNGSLPVSLLPKDHGFSSGKLPLLMHVFCFEPLGNRYNLCSASSNGVVALLSCPQLI